MKRILKEVILVLLLIIGYFIALLINVGPYMFLIGYLLGIFYMEALRGIQKKDEDNK